MQKKVIIAAVVAGIVGGPVQAACPHTGFSIGANLGYSGADGKLQKTIQTVPPGSDNSNFGAQGPNVGLFLGYGWAPQPNGVYLGAEVFGQIDTIKAKREEQLGTVVANITKATATNTAGIDAKLGYLCKDALWFFKLGAAATKWKLQFTDPAPTTTTKNQRKVGLLLGIGMDHLIAKHVTFGGEFVYVTYGSLKKISYSEATVSYKPKVATFNLRLKYTF